MNFPERIDWAVRLLRPYPGMRVLEIGCGRGHAARALAPHLGASGYVGLDRSKVAVQASRKLNIESDGRGITRFVLGALGEADIGGRPFDVVLAINVNAFWTDGGEAAAACLPLLKKQGRMLLVYELPSLDRIAPTREKLERSLRAGSFLMLNAVKAPDPKKPWIAMWARKG